ncbi:prolyl oligopeptidase family serine peptidase [Pseudonocardia thermophila]|uniref:prolyl oligopeptidase family serine peptidase n=1 Tax=Pseudonocardia thermophila TaxID=1848 RepID=UPI00248E48EC|nr:prolyl oligopeptidase family serine peptidase [Pseudonocardia thermophila]
MPTTFHDLEAYQKLPRLSGLVLSPDGSRLVTSVSEPDPKGTRFRSALWEIDPAGRRPARRLTRGSKPDTAAQFLPSGELLFTSARPDPAAAKPDEDAPAALWLLPEAGEARAVGTRPGGIATPMVAREAGTVVVTSLTLPTASTAEEDQQRRTARKDRGVSAILHTGYPVRYWDADLGPDQPRLLVGAIPDDGAHVQWHDLTPDAGPALRNASYDVTPDGSTVVTGWTVPAERGDRRAQIVAIDVASGERRVLAGDAAHDYGGPVVSPDGRRVVCSRSTLPTPTRCPEQDLVVLAVDGSAEPRVVTEGWDRWPIWYRWTADSAALIVTADDRGRSPVFRLELDGAVTKLTGDDGAYTDLVVAPDGSAVYALRSSIDRMPAPVRLDPTTPEQEPVGLPAPAETPELPGTLTEVTATAEDGTPLRSWLVLPEGASAQRPAPLVLAIHGGPLGSWNAWQWRWNPWLIAARGYAVLLPDPALSTGYGSDFVQRGWGAWGAAPYTDLMALTDAAVARPDIDETRTAAAGGSFGGYMANWIAGHTDRFRAIVTHASLWALDQFGPTTDVATYWRHEMSPSMEQANSPHRFAEKITSPMLVIHGDRDYRVPIGEALRLWYDLVNGHDGPPEEFPHRFLYFPDENHWILTPGNAVVWYQTVLAFLDHHVLGEEWQTPDDLT